MNIMVGYDGTKVAKEVLLASIEHAKAFGANVHLITSLTSGEEKDRTDIEQAEAKVEYARGLIESKDIQCQTHLMIRGLSVGEDLVQFANDNDIDEIVVGIKKRSKVGKLIMGSTAQYVILKAKCPVLTVK